MIGIADDPSVDKEPEDNGVKETANADSDSDDEGPIVFRRNKKKVNKSIEDSSEDDEPKVTEKEDTIVPKPVLGSSSSSDDSDEDVVVTKKKKVKKPVKRTKIIDSSDSDSSDDDAKSSQKSSTKVTEKKDTIASQSFLGSSDESDEDFMDTNEKQVKKPVKKTKVLDSSSNSDSSEASDGDSSDDDAKSSQKSAKKSKDKPFSNLSDDDEASRQSTNGKHSSQEGETSFTSIQPKIQNSDLFDAEGSSDEEKEGSDGSDSEKASGEDDGDDNPELSAALRKKLAKGAAKKKSSTKERAASQRPTREDVQQIHSESQRIVRESRASVPYHQPAKVGLSVFLARTKQKQEAFKALPNKRAAIKVPSMALLGQPSVIPEKTKPQAKELKTDSVLDQLTKVKEILNEKESSMEETHASGSEEIKKQLFGETESSEVCTVLKEDTAMDTAEDLCKVVVLQEKDSIETDCVETVLAQENLDTTKEECSATGIKLSAEVSKEDSGYLTHITTSEEENSGDHLANMENVQTADNNDEVDSNAVLGDCKDGVTDVEVVGKGLSAISDKLAVPVSKVVMAGGVMPRLSGGPDDFVDLEDDDLEVPAKSAPAPGITQLMQRLMKHSTNKKKKSKQVTVSTVRKTSEEGGKEELKLETFTYQEGEEEESDGHEHTPGAKLLRLKEKLAEKMKVKRDEARQLRCQMYSLDNEEGFEEGKEDEEAELTDQTDTDEEKFDEEEEEMGGEEEEEEEEEEVVEIERKKASNPFADDEAEDEDDEQEDEDEAITEEGDLHLALDTPEESQDGVSCNMSTKTMLQKHKTMVLFEDDDTNDDGHTGSQDTDILERPFGDLNRSPNEPRPPSGMSKDFSFEMQGSLFPAAQNSTKTQDTAEPLTCPVRSPSQQFHLHFDDDSATMSQMLDADGFLKTSNSGSDKGAASAASIKKLTTAQSIMEEDNDDILDLCSGQFGTQATGGFAGSMTQGGAGGGEMDELLGLCSGQFTTQRQMLSTQRQSSVDSETNSNAQKQQDVEDSPVKLKSRKGRAMLVDDDDDDEDAEEGKDKQEDDGQESFGIASDREDAEEEEEVEEKAEALDSDEEAEVDKENAKPKKKQRRGEFFDEEAELSGSDAGSADEFDGGDDDEMERMSGDEDVMDQEELRNQVGRVHLKLDMDENQRDLARLQEMLLPDGDLTGKGRTRKFKWQNVDEDTQQDLFTSDTEDKEDEDAAVTEDKWRKERFEREKYLQELNESEANKEEDGDTQLFKLGMRVFKSKKGNTPDGTFKVPALRKTHGSFLKRSQADLAKIAEMSKPVSNVNGPRNSRSFVFQAVSPDEKEAPTEEEEKQPKRRAHVKRSLSVQQPTAKRPKLEKSSSIPPDSIFNLMH